MPSATPLDAIRHGARWFDDGPGGIHPILDAIGDARNVLIGEASHGTFEFYRIRADVTKALIERQGFNIVAVEADWPDAYRANRWVGHRSDDWV
jgi:erythromycin esterase-like protein